MKAVYTKKFKEAILEEIACWETTKDSNCFNVIFRIPYPQKPLKSSDIVSNAMHYIKNGFIEKCVFSKRENGNWMCDTYPNYGYSEHTPFFSLGYLELKEDNLISHKPQRAMTNKELIETLNQLPPDAEVWIAYDSDVRIPVEVGYLSRRRQVVLAERTEMISSNENRPMNAPSMKEDPFWCLKKHKQEKS